MDPTAPPSVCGSPNRKTNSRASQGGVEAFRSRRRILELQARVVRNPHHLLVVMLGIVVKKNQLLRPRIPRHQNALAHVLWPHPRCVSYSAGVYCASQIRTSASCAYSRRILSESRFAVLVVGRVNDHSAVAFNSIPRRALRMIQRKRANGQICRPLPRHPCQSGGNPVWPPPG